MSANCIRFRWIWALRCPSGPNGGPVNASGLGRVARRWSWIYPRAARMPRDASIVSAERRRRDAIGDRLAVAGEHDRADALLAQRANGLRGGVARGVGDGCCATTACGRHG
jgi:hypothetical protein